jgi:hypothetical protein
MNIYDEHESPNETQRNSKIYYITVATKPHPVLYRIKEKVKRNGEQIIVLGEEENRYIGWQSTQNFGVKLREVYQFLQRPELNPNDVVLFTDAYDVAYGGNKTEIVSRYYTFIKPIIFGCETQCSPDPVRASNYPVQNIEFPFLNSGMFIGRVWALKQCMLGYQYNDNDDDQRFWTTQFFAHPELIELDYENKLFLNTVDIDMKWFTWNGRSACYKYKNPIFIHVNGPDKSLIEKLI